jgi:hypothetical protein
MRGPRSRAGVAAAEHHDMLPRREDLTLGIDAIPGVATVLLAQEIHREVDSREGTALDRQIARLLGPAAQQDGIEAATQVARPQIDADVDARLERNPFLAHLLDARVDDALLELELRDPVAQQPPDAVALLEHRGGVPRAIELLRRRETRRTRADDRHRATGPPLGLDRLDPPLAPAAPGDLPFDLLDRDGVVVDPEHARRLARRRAEQAGPLGKVVGECSASASSTVPIDESFQPESRC